MNADDVPATLAAWIRENAPALRAAEAGKLAFTWSVRGGSLQLEFTACDRLPLSGELVTAATAQAHRNGRQSAHSGA